MGDNLEIEKWLPPSDRIKKSIELMKRNGTNYLTVDSYGVIADLIISHPPDGEFRMRPTPASNKMTEFIEKPIAPEFEYLIEHARYLRVFETAPGFTIYRLPQVQFSPDIIPTIMLSSTREQVASWEWAFRKIDIYPDLERYLFIDGPTPWQDSLGILDPVRLDGKSNVTFGQVFIVPGTEQRPGNIFSLSHHSFKHGLTLTEQNFESLVEPLTDELKYRVRDSYAAALAYTQGEEVFSQYQLRKPLSTFPRKMEFQEFRT